MGSEEAAVMANVCPKCKSSRLMQMAKKDVFKCLDCGQRFRLVPE